MAAGTLEQHIHGAADTAAIERRLIAIDGVLQALQAVRFHVVRHLIVHVGAGCAGPRRIFERECTGIADFADQAERGSEVRFGFAGKADDEIGGERQIWPRVAQALDDCKVIGAAVTAVHGREHAVGAGLHRQMQLRHQLRQIAMGGDEIVVHVARMAGRVTQPVDARQFGDPFEQPRQ